MADLALDFSGARPDPDELVRVSCRVILVYTGNGRPSLAYLEDVLARGIGVCFIQETSPSRSWDSGYAGGVADAHYADMRVDEYGYPDDAVIYYAVSDNNRSFPGLPQAHAIAEYARGIGDTTHRPAFGVYGNRLAVNSAKSGHVKCDRSWVPSTWDADTTDVLWQMANVSAPLANTDTNHIIHAVEDLGAWGTGDDMTPEQAAQLTEVLGILNGGALYPAMEVRIESEVRKIVAEELAKLPTGGTGSAAGGPLTITLTGTAKPG